jgi:hypothetical protein
LLNKFLHGSNTQAIAFTNPNHPEITGFVAELRKFAEQFVQFIDELRIQTVIFEADPKVSPEQVTISVISSGGISSSGVQSAPTESTTKQNNTIAVKGKINAIYDTTMKLNGDVQNMYLLVAILQYGAGITL